MEKQKIIRTIIISSIVVILVAIGIYNMYAGSGDIKILGTWEAKAADGTVVSYEFTDDIDNANSKQTVYHLTVTKNGKTEKEDGTYNISNDDVLTFRPDGTEAHQSTTATFKIEKDTLTCKYEIDFLGEQEIVFTKTAEYEKK